MHDPIIVRRHVPDADLAHVFAMYTTPAAICRWNAASDDWQTSEAVLDIRAGARLRLTRRRRS